MFKVETAGQVMAEKGPIPETRMNQILQFRVEKRQLVVHTPLHAPILDRRADIVGFGMPAELSYTESVPADPESSQLEFTLRGLPGQADQRAYPRVLPAQHAGNRRSADRKLAANGI